MKASVRRFNISALFGRCPRLGRRLGAMALSLALLAGMVPLVGVLPLAAAAQDERFERFNAWDAAGKGAVSLTEGVSGNGALLTMSGGGEATLTSELTAVTAGQKYRAGVSVKSDAAASAAALRVQFFSDAEGKKTVGEETEIAASAPGAAFAELAGDVTVPEGASYAKLTIAFGNDQSAAGETYAADNAFL